eukprot:2013658-Prymnesium_polylepis.1
MRVGVCSALKDLRADQAERRYSMVEASECAGFKERWRTKAVVGGAAAFFGRCEGDGRVAQPAARELGGAADRSHARREERGAPDLREVLCKEGGARGGEGS